MAILGTGKNIFSSDIVIASTEETESSTPVSSNESIKLYHGIELITGRKINGQSKQHADLCIVCFHKVESYLKYRAQLLMSTNALNNLYEIDNGLTCTSSSEANNSSSSNTNNETITSSNDKHTSLHDEIIQKNSADNQRVQESKISSAEVINVDENSVSLNFNNSANNASDTNESVGSSETYNDNENNNVNGSENSDGSSEISVSKETISKVQENDIESDIDVCSGEDDEVLELDVQCKKDETVEISSTSESDIEVCDYEPTAKRIKYYNTFSPPMLF